MKKVTVNGTVVSHERYLYRGYLQLAALDMLDNRNVLRTLLWDPLEPVATRPLALVQENALYCYGVDFNKNVTEVFAGEGAIAATYDYSPYGQVVSTGDLVQPVQWSSEMNDVELALVYYNYRYYNPADGRWINRDPITEEGGWNLYEFMGNICVYKCDYLGLKDWTCDKKHLGWYDKLSFTLTNTIGGEEYAVSDPQSVIIGTFKEKLQDAAKSILEQEIDGRQIIEAARKAVNDNWFMRSLSGIVQNTRTNAYILEETKLSVKLEYCCCEIDNKGKIKYFMNPVSGVDSFNLIFSLKEASMRRMNTYTNQLKVMLKRTASNLKKKACKKQKK